MARINGRVPLSLIEFSAVKPANKLTFFLNRNYVTPELKQCLIETAFEVNRIKPGTVINYLDANFPFWDGFPLLFHLSHNDGKKIDLAFSYKDLLTALPSKRIPTFTGYGAFENPLQGEVNTSEMCKAKGYWQYDFANNLNLGHDRNLQLDVERTSLLIKSLCRHTEVQKLFLEPHLKTRWKLSYLDKIRFHGCHASRHDDHIHLQVR